MRDDSVCNRAVWATAVLAVGTLVATARAAQQEWTSQCLNQLEGQRGVCAVLVGPSSDADAFVLRLAAASQLKVYLQTADRKTAERLRRAAHRAGLLGKRLFVETGSLRSVHLANDLADWVVVLPEAAGKTPRQELLRVLRPLGTALLSDGRLQKPAAQGVDYWSHPYHGPDNNPLSHDQQARAPYQTQFLAEPLFSPMPQVTVAAGGKVYRAFGHIAHKANQNPMLNTLICVNAYNGTILWKRPLREGFMIHRNTMVATPDALYLADDQSCKIIDPDTGQVRDEIVVPEGLSDGPVWKWMALVDGVLYALVGGQEVHVRTVRSQTPGLGHWPWGMWQGHDYSDPKTNFGFGRTFLAIDPKTKKVLWSHREADYIDARGVCMGNGRIYYYSPEKFLACLDASTGRVVWKNDSRQLLEAIGPNGRAQHYVTGYATTAYVKCTDRYVFFAGPQRARLVVVKADTGELLWQKESGNYQLVLRDDAIYAAGPQVRNQPNAFTGLKLDYATGRVLGRLPMRRACTRATGSVDSIFYRATGGTVRLDVRTGQAEHIAPMRPPCQDGVVISDGHLYWGPWMCGCQLSLYGHICLSHAAPLPGADEPRLAQAEQLSVQPLSVEPDDWPCFLGDNEHRADTSVAVPSTRPEQRWTFTVPDALPTAPVAAGGLYFVADRNGVVYGLDEDGRLKWTAYTGGAVYFPPAVADGRVFVGSADGRVYAFEAKTGRWLWSFRVAPGQRRIPVYGKLISTWPVAGGVVVQNGTVYAAAGLTHYDGTYVVALDAATGRPKWQNDRSGRLCPKTNRGVSLQGELFVQDGELRFLGGGVYEFARFDLKTGRCLNEVKEGLSSQYHTAFYAYYPDYGKYLSLDYMLPDRSLLVFDASYEGSRFSNLARLSPLPPGARRPVKPASRWMRLRTPGPRQRPIWADRSGRRFTSFVVAPNALLAAGHEARDPQRAFVVAIDLNTGRDLWRLDLPSLVVKGGLAVDRDGRVVASLENGQVVCWSQPDVR